MSLGTGIKPTEKVLKPRIKITVSKLTIDKPLGHQLSIKKPLSKTTRYQ